MLPPIDTTLLSSNPKFEIVYQDLCTNKLNPDGSSKLDAKAQRERDGLSEELRRARIGAAKRDLIKTELANLSYRGDELPAELQEVVGIVATLLDGQVSNTDRDLLHTEVEKFEENIDSIADVLSAHFQQDATALASILNPDDPPTAKQLPSVIQEINNTIAANQYRLSQTRLAFAVEIANFYDLHQRVLETTVRILEQTIHGSVARGAKAKADYLAQVAEGMNKKLSVQHAQLLNQLYSPEFHGSIKQKAADLDDETPRVKRKIREAEATLEEYRRVGGAASLLSEYAEILKDTEKVKADISRLESR